MEERITKNTAIVDIHKLLEAKQIPLSFGRKQVIFELLKGCDYLTIEGTGCRAAFVRHKGV